LNSVKSPNEKVAVAGGRLPSRLTRPGAAVACLSITVETTSHASTVPSAPRKATDGPGLDQEIKHDGFRILARRDAERVRLFPPRHRFYRPLSNDCCRGQEAAAAVMRARRRGIVVNTDGLSVDPLSATQVGPLRTTRSARTFITGVRHAGKIGQKDAQLERDIRLFLRLLITFTLSFVGLLRSNISRVTQGFQSATVRAARRSTKCEASVVPADQGGLHEREPKRLGGKAGGSLLLPPGSGSWENHHI
jgi:hypothetical protein